LPPLQPPCAAGRYSDNRMQDKVLHGVSRYCSCIFAAAAPPSHSRPEGQGSERGGAYYKAKPYLFLEQRE